MTTLTLTPGAVTLADLARIYWDEANLRLDESCRPAIQLAADRIAAAAAGNAAIYGVNTGFGKLASLKIAPQDTAKLQENLILSHCCGVGEPLDAATTRLMMALKLLSLGRGVAKIPEPLFFYRIQESSRTTQFMEHRPNVVATYAEIFRANLDFFARHGGCRSRRSGHSRSPDGGHGWRGGARHAGNPGFGCRCASRRGRSA